MRYFYLLYLSHSNFLYISVFSFAAAIQQIVYVSCCVLPSVVALLVLVCFKAISHIVTGLPQVTTECSLGLFTLWCSELICSFLCLSLFLCFSLHLAIAPPPLLQSSVFPFGCLITLLIVRIVSSQINFACLQVYILCLHIPLLNYLYCQGNGKHCQSNEVYKTINLNQQG